MNDQVRGMGLRYGRAKMHRGKHTEIVSNGTIGRRLLNVGEAAQYLGVSVDTLHKWVQLRAIPHVKAGRALRFDLVALNRYIDEHTIGTID
jgi:excisionase family DNA binding protein